MADEEKKKTFWETLPGIITALAALIGAIATLVAALNSSRGKEGATKTEAAAVQAAAPAVQPSSMPSANDGAARRAKAEADAAEAKARAAEKQTTAQTAELQQGAVTTTTEGLTGMKLAYVPGGCFMMGSSAEDKNHQDDEGPMHNVCVGSFWMGQFEVTQGQWEKVMGENPSHFKKGGSYPAEQISWDDAQDFIKKLNSGTGKNYRLPTEAEWEYACRAGGSGTYCGGNDADAAAWHKGNSDSVTHAAGGKKANGFGLYDMSGNVWEWCADWYGSSYYASSPKNSPQGPDSGESRVLRGGSSFNSPIFCRAADRDVSPPGLRNGSIGFRLVLPFQP